MHDAKHDGRKYVYTRGVAQKQLDPEMLAETTLLTLRHKKIGKKRRSRFWATEATGANSKSTTFIIQIPDTLADNHTGCPAEVTAPA